MPTNGGKTARVSAHSSNQFIAVPPRGHECPLFSHSVQLKITRARANSPDRREHDEGVPLQADRLDVEQTAGLTGLLGDPVDRAVDHPLVDASIRRLPRAPRAPCPRTDGASITFWLTQYAPRDRALDAGDDHTFVQRIEVVLVDEERVARRGSVVALREALRTRGAPRGGTRGTPRDADGDRRDNEGVDARA